MKPHILTGIIAWFFILLFLYTGVEKFAEITTFRDQLVSSPLLGSVAGFVTWALPITEVILAVILFIPKWQLKGLYASLALMAAFTIYLSAILLIDNHLTCSCGGIIENLPPRQHLLFNGASIILAIIAIRCARRPSEASPKFQKLRITAASLLFLMMGWIIFTSALAPAKQRTGLEGRLLPSFSLLLADSLTHLNTADIPTGKPFIIVGFSPYCIHCQAEMREIIKNITRFGDTSIYFVTSFPYSDMKKFYDAFHLKRYPNIVTAVDSSDTYIRYFKANFIPYITVFDAKKRLKAVLPGEAKAETLSESLHD